jgi:hypothetical protein
MEDMESNLPSTHLSETQSYLKDTECGIPLNHFKITPIIKIPSFTDYISWITIYPNNEYEIAEQIPNQNVEISEGNPSHNH